MMKFREFKYILEQLETLDEEQLETLDEGFLSKLGTVAKFAGNVALKTGKVAFKTAAVVGKGVNSVLANGSTTYKNTSKHADKAIKKIYSTVVKANRPKPVKPPQPEKKSDNGQQGQNGQQNDPNAPRNPNQR